MCACAIYVLVCSFIVSVQVKLVEQSKRSVQFETKLILPGKQWLYYRDCFRDNIDSLDVNQLDPIEYFTNDEFHKFVFGIIIEGLCV